MKYIDLILDVLLSFYVIIFHKILDTSYRYLYSMNLEQALHNDIKSSLESSENGLLNGDYIDACQCRYNLRYLLLSIHNAPSSTLCHNANIICRHNNILQNQPMLRKCHHIWKDTHIRAAMAVLKIEQIMDLNSAIKPQAQNESSTKRSIDIQESN